MSLKRKYQDLESDYKYSIGEVANGLSNSLPTKSHITKWPNNILVMILHYEPFTLSMVNKHLRSEALSLIFKSIKSPELVSKSSLKNENTIQSFLDYFSLFVKDKKKASAVKHFNLNITSADQSTQTNDKLFTLAQYVKSNKLPNLHSLTLQLRNEVDFNAFKCNENIHQIHLFLSNFDAVLCNVKKSAIISITHKFPNLKHLKIDINNVTNYNIEEDGNIESYGHNLLSYVIPVENRSLTNIDIQINVKDEVYNHKHISNNNERKWQWSFERDKNYGTIWQWSFERDTIGLNLNSCDNLQLG